MLRAERALWVTVVCSRLAGQVLIEEINLHGQTTAEDSGRNCESKKLAMQLYFDKETCVH